MYIYIVGSLPQILKYIYTYTYIHTIPLHYIIITYSYNHYI